MLFRSDYQLVEKIYQGRNSTIYRGVALTDNSKSVIIKIPLTKLPNTTGTDKLRREFELRQRITSEHVVNYLALLPDTTYGVILIEEDDQADVLTEHIPSQGFEPEAFLKIAIQLAKGLNAIHQGNVIHKDIKPSNIIIRPETNQIKYLDFGSASLLRQLNQNISSPSISEGTLAYISPEQTGRTNRLIDYRTDFYSLGVTFYQLLCGHLPFASTQPLELIHCHIAQQPKPLCEVKPTISDPLSDIVMKLLNKDADDRYQSAEGLLHDLQICWNELQDEGEIRPFLLAQQDFSNYFYIPQKLYGREQELSILANAFYRMSQGKPEVLLITGPAGSGKSVLVNELQPTIAAHKGLFLAGKFEQFNRNTAYSAPIQAFQAWIKQLLLQGEEEISHWKTQWLAALGNQGQIIIDMLPEVEFIIGKQVPVPLLEIEQTKNRFHLVFQNFIRVIATAEHPLVLFFDDWQWADNASLHLIETLMTSSETLSILLIGAYRAEEVNASHPILRVLETFKKAAVSIQTINLAPLDITSINAWITDIMHTSPEQTLALTELMVQKTAGNPFFIKVFLQALYEAGLFTRSEQGCWQWDLDRIRQYPATDNVVELMTHQIKQLPLATQQALAKASCLGHQFTLDILHTLTQESFEQLLSDLQPAIDSGFFLQVEGNFQFTHDRIHEAAYQLISQEKRAKIHYSIGHLLYSRLPTAPSSEQLFKVVNHLNQGQSIIDSYELIELAKLNLAASQKAKCATAYADALHYLQTAESNLIAFNVWQEDYPLAFELYKELVEVYYLNEHYEQAEASAQLLLSHTHSALEKARVYDLLITQNTMTARYNKAIELGYQALELVGVGLPKINLSDALKNKLYNIQSKLAAKEIAALLDAPPMLVAEKKLALRLLCNIMPPAFITNLELYLIVVAEMVDISLIYGNGLDSPMAYALYGRLLCTIIKDYKAGYEFGNLALQLSDKLNSPALKCKASFLYLHAIFHWNLYLREKEADLISEAGYQAGLEAGEFQYIGYHNIEKAIRLFHRGEPLNVLASTLVNLLQFPMKTNNQMAIGAIRIVQLITANLMGATARDTEFSYEGVLDAEYQQSWQEQLHYTGICDYAIMKGYALYLHGHYELALESLLIAEKLLNFMGGMIGVAIHNFCYSLTLTALYKQASYEQQQHFWQNMEANQKQMKIWADHCPENFLHKYLLVTAEMASIQGQNWEAAEYYDEAIRLANEQEFIQDHALACELAANFWLARNKPFCAQSYLNYACQSYLQWGAQRKVHVLQVQHRELLKPVFSAHLSGFTTSNEVNISESSLALLDLTSVIKASQTISSEIDLSKLLSIILNTIIENAGAQTGAFFMEEQGALWLQAEYTLGGQITTLQKLPLLAWAKGALSIIEYVKRTRQTVLLGHACKNKPFSQDAYIEAHQIKSILCLPIIKQQKLKGILYIENNLAPNLFTDQHVNILLLLASQMAISLENASYFGQLAEQTAQTQNALKQVEEKERQRDLALKAANIGIWSWDIKTNQLITDDRLLSLYGVTRENFESRYESFIALIHSDDQRRIETALKQALEENVPFEVEFRVVRPNDSSVHILAGRADVYRNAQGQPERMIGVNWDITQQKRLEEERLLAAVLKASQVIQSETLFDQFATMGQDWNTVKNEMVMGVSKYASQKKEIALGHMKGLVEYRDFLDYAIYQRAIEAIFPSKYYEITTRLEENIEATQEGNYQFKSTGYTFIVYYRADPASLSRSRCEIKIDAPGSRTLTSDIDTSIYVTGITNDYPLNLTFADSSVRDQGPDYNGRVRNQVIAHFYRLSEELHHMTSSESRDSNAYADIVTDDEKEYSKFHFTENNNPIINGKPFIQDAQFYAKQKLAKHYHVQAASFVSLRRALKPNEWETFKNQLITHFQNTFRIIYPDNRNEHYFSIAEADIKQILLLAETFHQESEQILDAKIAQIEKERADYWASSPLSKSPERLALDMKISAMNMLYVDYLEKVTDSHNEIIHLTRQQRDLVIQLSDFYSQQKVAKKDLEELNIVSNQNLLTQQVCNMLSQQIKLIEQQLFICLIQKADKMLEKQVLQIKANLFAHGAYISRSAIYHVVKGMMLSKGKLTLSKQTVIGSALEQIGVRILHADELRLEHKSESEIAYYCAKYGQRVFDLLFNNSDTYRETPYSREQIETLAKGTKNDSLTILPRLKVSLQTQLHSLFTLEEYHLINSEMGIITQIKRASTISEKEKLEKTLELLKVRMNLINKEAYPSQKKIKEEDIQVFTKTTERSLFISIAIKFMLAVYIAKLEHKKGELWGKMAVQQAMQKQTPLASAVCLSTPSTLFFAPSQTKRVWMAGDLRNFLYPILDKLSDVFKSLGVSIVMPLTKYHAKTSLTGWQLYTLVEKDEHWAVLNLANETDVDKLMAAINQSRAQLRATKMKSGSLNVLVIAFSTQVSLKTEIEKILPSIRALAWPARGLIGTSYPV